MAVAENSQSTYSWHPIEPLTSLDRQIDLADVRPLYDAWRTAKENIKAKNGDTLRNFTDRLVRSLSIETGIIERIYDVDRGTTEALVTHGFMEDLVARSSTNVEPPKLIEILRDQEEAIRLVIDGVAHNREMTRGFLHELHATMTRHQSHTDGVDQLGRNVRIPLQRGDFKIHPNNPVRDDGSVHEYCPPLQVVPEIDRLLAMYATYEEDVDPILVSAWLHHRFTQIHPYQDGNGRMARALVTLVLTKADLLPIVVDRDSRVDYIKALEHADRGDLGYLVRQFGTLEKRAILQALSVETEGAVVGSRSVSREVVASLQAKLARRRLEKDEQLRQVNIVARSLRARAEHIVRNALKSLESTVQEVSDAHVYVNLGGPDQNNSYWYKFEAVQSAKASGKWVNLDEDHYFVKGTLNSEQIRLVFVASLHHIGRELTGIMEATAFAWLEAREGFGDHADSAKQYFPASIEPFVIAWNTSAEEVQPLFDEWLDTALAVAFKEFADRV